MRDLVENSVTTVQVCGAAAGASDMLTSDTIPLLPNEEFLEVARTLFQYSIDEHPGTLWLRMHIHSDIHRTFHGETVVSELHRRSVAVSNGVPLVQTDASPLLEVKAPGTPTSVQSVHSAVLPSTQAIVGDVPNDVLLDPNFVRPMTTTTLLSRRRGSYKRSVRNPLLGQSTPRGESNGIGSLGSQSTDRDDSEHTRGAFPPTPHVVSLHSDSTESAHVDSIGLGTDSSQDDAHHDGILFASSVQAFHDDRNISSCVLASLDLRYRVATVCFEHALWDYAQEHFLFVTCACDALMAEGKLSSHVFGLRLLWEASQLGLARVALEESKLVAAKLAKSARWKKKLLHDEGAERIIQTRRMKLLDEATTVCRRVEVSHQQHSPLAKECSLSLTISPPSSQQVLAARRQQLAVARGAPLIGSTTQTPGVSDTQSVSSRGSRRSSARSQSKSSKHHIEPQCAVDAFFRPAGKRMIARLSGPITSVTGDETLHLIEMDAGISVDVFLLNQSERSLENIGRKKVEDYSARRHLLERSFVHHLQVDLLLLQCALWAELGSLPKAISLAQKAVGVSATFFGLNSDERNECLERLKALQRRREIQQAQAEKSQTNPSTVENTDCTNLTDEEEFS